MSSISVNSLSKTYSQGKIRVEALAPISFEIESGQYVFLRGPNGCGKSTLINILATLIQPTSGSFLINGIKATQSSKIRQSIAFIPDNFSFDYSLSPKTFWQLAVGYRNIADKKRKELFDKYMIKVGLTRWMEKPLGAFSLGMKKRFLLALWLSFEPSVLLLDEFDSGIDDEGKKIIGEILEEDLQITILGISHSLHLNLGKTINEIEFGTLTD